MKFYIILYIFYEFLIENKKHLEDLIKKGGRPKIPNLKYYDTFSEASDSNTKTKTPNVKQKKIKPIKKRTYALSSDEENTNESSKKRKSEEKSHSHIEASGSQSNIPCSSEYYFQNKVN